MEKENTVEVTTIRTKETIIEEVKVIRDEVNNTAIIGAIRIGNKFKELKELVGHGSWLDYIEENLAWSDRKVQQFIKISDTYGDESSNFSKLISNPNMCADLSFSKALKLLSVSEEEVETFVEEVKVEDVSTKELEEEIKKYKDLAADKDKMLDDISSEYDDLIKEKEKAEEDKRKLEEQLKQAKESKDEEVTSENDNEELEKEIENLNKKINTSEEKLAKAKEKAEKEKEKAIKDAREKIEKEKEEEIKKLKEEIVNSKTEIEAEKRKTANASDETLVMFSAAVDILQNNIVEVKQYIDTMANKDKEKASNMKEAVIKIVSEILE